MQAGKRLNILVVAPTPFFADRGTHIRILEEALAMERRGHTVTIATYHIGKDIPELLGSKIDVRRIRRLLFWYKKLEAGPDWQKIILDLLLIKKVLFLARTKRPDVIHGHLHEGVIIGWIVQKLLFWRKMILVADFHGSLVKEMVSHAYLGQGFLKAVFRWIERWIDNMGDAAVTSSWENTEEISRIRKSGTADVLLDGVRVEMFENLPEKNALRREYGIPEDKIVVTYTGALIPNKGIQFFLEAIPLVVEQYPQAHFVIAGFPYDQIEDRIKGQSWEKSVSMDLPSPLPYFTLPKILKLSDIGVDPKEASVRQASGKTLQYMGAGLSIACFDTKNNREYLGEGGAFAKEVSGSGLAEAIGRLVQSAWLRQKYGTLNRERAKQFTWMQPAEKLEKIYEKLLKQ